MILLQQLIPPGMAPGRVLQLVDTTTPEEGVMQRRDLILARTRYPGGEVQDVQYMGLEDGDVELTGHLRDDWNSPGFANAARKSLQAMQNEAFPIWLTWDGRWGRLVAISGLEFEFFRTGETYNLTLTPLSLGELSTAIPSQDVPGAAARALANLETSASDLEALDLPEGL